ncbi:MAG: T9SS type A sorting domain-containing protein [Chitinophagaceae bacterium]|nr:T9SS type A sorting domain-containing protein [Chitinophagaceae bacterium]
MKKIFALIAAFVLIVCTASAQLLTWTSDFAKDTDPIVITMDATKGNQGLNGYTPTSDVYVHIGLITDSSTSPTNWHYTKFTWGTTPVAAQATYIGSNKWTYTITGSIRSFFGVTAGVGIKRIAILFRNGAGTSVQRNADASDMYVPVYTSALAARFSVPLYQPTYVRIPEPISKNVGDNISLAGIASASSNMRLWLNGNLIQTANGATTISANPTLTTSGNTEIILDATGGGFASDTLRFFVSPTVTIAPLPPGVRDGINYSVINTEITLVLYAPGKNRVSVIGEFPGSNWVEQNNYLMNKTPDGNYWWLKITGLTPGTEYAFQYLVDGALKIAEPYAEKVLDPNWDPQISAATYPGLRSYPAGQSGIVSIVQTNAPGYTWTNNSFSRPDKRNLVVYELLMRDFLLAHDWNTLRDTLNYLKNLGVNAIEIMPFHDADYQGSWGYDPNFFFAPDKWFGPKNALKRFIDTCHSRGIAVIMDIVLNHATGTCPLAALYWNSTTNQPAANNPWFNVSATHPYNVFNDFNHESLATRYFTGRVIEHWLTEFKLDGFRWDLSKGFTQNTQCGGSTTNESCIAAYHADRVAIWKRYYDTMQLKSPGTYCILEHFADNTEETELSNYGLMLWGNASFNFQEATMGYIPNSNFDHLLHTTRSWANPYLVGYMESHDEERIMYKNLQFGNNSNASHNVRDLTTALKRSEMSAAFLLSMPGPKMIWEFGELGYDFSINRCVNGTIDNNCRLDPKPIRWDYLQQVQRKRVYDIYAAVLKLRAHGWYKDVFIANGTTISRNMSGAFKWLTVRSATDSSMMAVIGNFEVTAQTSSFTFPTAGTWYDYLNGGTITATGSAQNITLQPGEYHVYLNRNLINAVVTSVSNVNNADDWKATVYPNPVSNSSLEILAAKTVAAEISIINQTGQLVCTAFKGVLIKGRNVLQLQDKISGLPSGTYLVRINASNKIVTVKMIIQ